MAEKTIKTIFILKHGTQFQFESNHIVLRDGEPSYTTDTHIFKIGDGETEWENLPTISDSCSYAKVISEEMADSLF
jgi:hypothetical protein